MRTVSSTPLQSMDDNAGTEGMEVHEHRDIGLSLLGDDLTLHQVCLIRYDNSRRMGLVASPERVSCGISAAGENRAKGTMWMRGMHSVVKPALSLHLVQLRGRVYNQCASRATARRGLAPITL